VEHYSTDLRTSETTDRPWTPLCVRPAPTGAVFRINLRTPWRAAEEPRGARGVGHHRPRGHQAGAAVVGRLAVGVVVVGRG
jgi:hypothetical protein